MFSSSFYDLDSVIADKNLFVKRECLWHIDEVQQHKPSPQVF